MNIVINILFVATIISFLFWLNNKGKKNCVEYCKAIVELMKRTQDTSKAIMDKYQSSTDEDEKDLYNLLAAPVVSELIYFNNFSEIIGNKVFYFDWLVSGKKVFYKKHDEFVRYMFNLNVAMETNNYSEGLVMKAAEIFVKLNEAL